MIDGQVKRFGARLTSNLLIVFVLTVITAFITITPVVYLCLYLAAVGLAMLAVRLFGHRRRRQKVQAA